MSKDTKRCPKCMTLKPVDAFGKLTPPCGKETLQSWCKKCRQAQWAKNRTRSADDGRKFRSWRPPTGEKHHHAKLSDIAVQSIMEKWQWPATEVADYISEFLPRGVTISPSRVKQIWSGA